MLYCIYKYVLNLYPLVGLDIRLRSYRSNFCYKDISLESIFAVAQKGWDWSHFNDLLHHCTFLRSSVRSFYRLISSASAPAMMFCTSFTSGTRWSQFFSQSRFYTIDRISRCRSFVTPENRRGLCSRREKIFAIGDPQYVHLCGKRLYVWQTRRHITLFISVECWPSCFSIDMLDDPYSSLVVLSSSRSIKP